MEDSDCINEEDSTCWPAFSHPVILKKLASFLNYGDLQQLRLTCRHLNRHILDHSGYRDRTLVRLDNPRFVNVSNFGRSTEKWLHYHIDASVGIGYNDKIPTHWLYYKLKCAKSLIITCLDPSHYKKYKNIPRFYQHLQNLLENPENLESLSIEADLLRGSRLVSTPRLNYTWENLEHLHLRGKQVLQDEELDNPICFPGGKMRHLKGLKVDEGVCALRLESPSSGGGGGAGSGSDMGPDFNTQRILRMVEMNEERLETLQLNSVIHWTTFESVSFCLVSEMTFPKLTSVSIQIRDYEDEEEEEEVSQNHLPLFFEMHPLLQEIRLDFLYECSNSIFLTISQCCPGLEKLKLRTCGFSSNSSDFWDFLDNFECLTSFELENVSWNCTDDIFTNSSQNSNPNSSSKDKNKNVNTNMNANVSKRNVHTAHEILTKLPLSIEEIHLDGLPQSYKRSINITEDSFDGLYLNNITSLVLRRSECLTDKSMEFICKEMTMLQKLDISYCCRVTDYGLTGLRKDSDPEENPEFSLQNITGLKWLGLRQCSEITEKTLENAIQFKELLHLDISQNFWVNINSPSIETLLENNESLERIRLSSHQCCLSINNNSLLPSTAIDEILTVRDKSLHELSLLYPRFRGFLIVEEKDEKKCKWEWRPTGEDEHADLIRMEREEYERLEAERKVREEKERKEREAKEEQERKEREAKEKAEKEQREREEQERIEKEKAAKEQEEKERQEREAEEALKKAQEVPAEPEPLPEPEANKENADENSNANSNKNEGDSIPAAESKEAE